MGIDLLRQQPRWKEGLLEIRQMMANLVQQVRFFFFHEVSVIHILGVLKFLCGRRQPPCQPVRMSATSRVNLLTVTESHVQSRGGVHLHDKSGSIR